MKSCTSCGAILADDSKYCCGCGCEQKEVQITQNSIRNIIPLTCPSCGANISIDSNLETASCDFCGKSFVVKDTVVQNYMNIITNINAETVYISQNKDFIIRGGVLEEYNGESLSVVIPSNVRVIGKDVFRDLPIESVILPEGLEEIGHSAFCNCAKLSEIKFPQSLLKIEPYAFYKTSIFEIVIPQYLCQIAFCAFDNSYTKLKVDQNNKKYISIQNLLVEKSSKKIIFGGTQEHIPSDENIRIIGYGAYTGSSIENLFVPSNIKVIENNVFGECHNLREIVLEGDTEVYELALPFRMNGIPVSVIQKNANDKTEKTFADEIRGEMLTKEEAQLREMNRKKKEMESIVENAISDMSKNIRTLVHNAKISNKAFEDNIIEGCASIIGAGYRYEFWNKFTKNQDEYFLDNRGCFRFASREKYNSFFSKNSTTYYEVVATDNGKKFLKDIESRANELGIEIIEFAINYAGNYIPINKSVKHTRYISLYKERNGEYEIETCNIELVAKYKMDLNK